VSDRILVMRDGRIVGEAGRGAPGGVPGDVPGGVTEAQVMAMAMDQAEGIAA